jgi:hypothetical protein
MLTAVTIATEEGLTPWKPDMADQHDGHGLKKPCASQLASMAEEISEGMVGKFVPKCDKDGDFMPVQCHGSTGTCWCADSQGIEVRGSRMSVRRSGQVLTPQRCYALTHQKQGPR